MPRTYAELPDRIMCLPRSRHRNLKMKVILNHYQKQYRAKAKKDELLEGMVSLQNEISDGEVALIMEWILRGEHETLGEAFKNGECSVCMERYPRSVAGYSRRWFPDRPLTDQCAHKVTACTSCTIQHVEHQIDDLPYDQISCPECPGTLIFEIVAKYSSQKAFEKYTEKGFFAAIEKMEGYVKCLAPDCKSSQIHGSGHDQPIVTCTACAFKTCYTHQMPWHSGQTCDQYDEERRLRWGQQEEASQRFLAENAKACPNAACGYFITKNGGCNHMTCRKCTHEFCWLCMASYSQIRQYGNSAHASTCLYHSARLPPVPRIFPFFNAY